MIKILKYIPLAILGKNVGQAYSEESGKERPFFLSRRFLGSVIALGSGFLAIQYGVKLTPEEIGNITDSLEKTLTAGATIYGAVITIIGYVKRNKEAVK